MQMRAILLGAGASKSYDQSPTGQRMPIARDFFDTFDKLDLSMCDRVKVKSREFLHKNDDKRFVNDYL